MAISNRPNNLELIETFEIITERVPDLDQKLKFAMEMTRAFDKMENEYPVAVSRSLKVTITQKLNYTLFFYAFLSRGDDHPRRSTTRTDWTDVYDTHNIEHRTEPVSH